GGEAGREALKTILGDIAPRGIRPHRGDTTVEIRRRLADGVRRHQRMAGGAVLAAPWLWAAGRSRLGRSGWVGLTCFRRSAVKDVAEKIERPGGLGRRRRRPKQRRSESHHARPSEWPFRLPRHTSPARSVTKPAF